MLDKDPAQRWADNMMAATPQSQAKVFQRSGLNRLVRPPAALAKRDLPCPRPPSGAILLHNPPELGELR
jgi:hypothetical protein